MATRYAIVDDCGRRVRTFHVGATGGVMPAVDDTYASCLECCLALIFQFGGFPGLRPVPVEGDVLDAPPPLFPLPPEITA